jgi:hypothetical protein
MFEENGKSGRGRAEILSRVMVVTVGGFGLTTGFIGLQ